MRKRLSWIALCGAMMSFGAPQAAFAGFAACTAADIIAKESNCPNNTNPCTIALDYDVTMNACFFDFGTRAVTIKGTSVIDALDRQGVRIKAGSITMETQSVIRGNGSAGNEKGASITIETSGNFTTQGIARIDVATNDFAGDVFLVVGGNAVLEGRILADGSTVNGIAGEIIIRVTGNVSTVRELSATNGNLSFSPGAIEVTADGTVTIGGIVNVSGGDGGTIDIDAGLGVTTNAVLDASGNGDAGTGGAIDILSGRGITINEALQANGNGGTGNTGGDGGTVLLEALYGDINLNDNVNAIGGVPDGSGDEISLVSEGSINLATGITLSARTDGALGSGGSLGVEAEVDVISTGILEASGGLEGGDLSISAGRNLTINRLVDAKGRNPGAFGGSVFIDAGLRTRGTLTINNTVDASGGICSSLEGCGAGGLLSLTGCAVTLTNSASLQNRGADGGDTFITARGVLTVSAATVANATTNVGLTEGTNGSNTFEHSATVAPSISPLANVQPPAMVAALAIAACATCGNGVVEVSEDCDDSNTNDCDGCSFACEIEVCPDDERCTVDTCVPLLGCLIGEAQPVGTACCDGAKERNCAINPFEDECNDGVCNLGTNACESVPKENGTACDDGLVCTAGDTCTAGTCGFEGCGCITDGQDPEDPCTDVVLCNYPSANACRVNLTPDGASCSGTTPSTQCCGNGLVDPSEECDAGGGNSQNPNAACRTDCSPRRCGDSVVDGSFGETCDDGNNTDGDGCSSTCGTQPTFTPTATRTPSPTPTVPPAIAGEVRYYGGAMEPVADVQVNLSGTQSASQTTLADGLYDFGNRASANFGVVPSKTGDTDGTITAYDAALALRAANGLDSFDDEQQLACDVNHDGVITEADVTLLLQYRVGSVAELPVVEHCGDWAFVPTGVGPEVVPPLTTGVTCETGRRQYTPLNARRVDEDYLAVIFGDCSGNWQAPQP